jgi:tRNA nucleotidyltransferase (CCA-adding enzyme)
MRNIKKILNEQITKIAPEKKELEKINKETKKFILDLKKKLKIYKADVFVGGSIAKKTLIKKDKYDVDIFVRFDKSYKDKEISEILNKLLNGKRIHGSRDYFQIEKEDAVFEIVPTIKISRPEQARNVTDLSYFHVKYVKNKIKNKKLAREIMLAKAFCYANSCYGAESYIKGFSGYALELLIIHYGSFLKFLKETKDKEKIIIDPEKHYKNKKDIMLEVNESKLQSPIIFVDPTYRQRNALAALSEETYRKFRETAKKFLENPDEGFFEKKDIETELKKRYKDLIIIETKTERQKGDIGGSKLKRFHEYMIYRLKRDFEIKKSEFEYIEEENTAKNYFVLKQKKEIIIEGPPVNSKANMNSFKKKHKKTFAKKGRIYSREKSRNFSEFFKELKKDRTLKEMEISEIK